MKKIRIASFILISCLILAVIFSFVSCGEDTCESHVDADKNEVCDNCGVAVPLDPKPQCDGHKDADGNAKCDNCGAAFSVTPPNDDETPDDPDDSDDQQTQPECTAHKDADGDYKCDNCGVEYGVPPDPEDDGKTDYSVKVVDGIGNPYPALVVKIFSSGTQQAMNATDENGVANFRLTPGSYTFEIMTTDSSGIFYDESLCKLSMFTVSVEIPIYSEISEADVVELMTEKDVSGTGTAHLISVGAYHTAFKNTELTFFVFVPEMAGKYRFSVEANTTVEVGFYGIPAYVRGSDLTKDSERESKSSICLDIDTSHIANETREGTPYVIGIKGLTKSGEGIIKVERIGDHTPTLSEIPYDEKYANENPESFDLPDGKQSTDLVFIDVTDADVKIVKGSDGLYHYGSADGPVVYMALDIAVPYLGDGTVATTDDTSTSISTMRGTNPFNCYIFDSAGNFESKVSYDAMMIAYIASCSVADDHDGVRPLDDKLIEAMQVFGKSMGWWKAGSNNTFFGEDAPDLVIDNAWMFACCYIPE